MIFAPSAVPDCLLNSSGSISHFPVCSSVSLTPALETPCGTGLTGTIWHGAGAGT
ncbi:hypothetical protein JB92DRAFT_2895889 [Gautieria morchelliformis]|nr:hypothetical protein JB92DRAFT_2895889 [Gautieria morchelliformis]